MADKYRVFLGQVFGGDQVDKRLNDEELRVLCERLLKMLTPREEKVLRMRYGLGVESDHTLEQVAQDFEVSRERIRQIEAKALRKMRRSSDRFEVQ